MKNDPERACSGTILIKNLKVWVIIDEAGNGQFCVEGKPAGGELVISKKLPIWNSTQ
ncbi:hypothetical protein [Roseibium algae]|uniref:Uncharacterized protein n=1 Tax=Roseibium algae TaxID=3123038 RepID=A0ABU8TRK5_9HYPH